MNFSRGNVHYNYIQHYKLCSTENCAFDSALEALFYYTLKDIFQYLVIKCNINISCNRKNHGENLIKRGKKNIWMNHRVKFVLLIIVSYCYFTSHRDNRHCNLLAGKRPHRKVEESSCNAWWRERSNKNCAILLYYYFSSFFFFYHIIVQQLYTTFQDVVKKNRDKKKEARLK